MEVLFWSQGSGSLQGEMLFQKNVGGSVTSVINAAAGEAPSPFWPSRATVLGNHVGEGGGRRA